MSPPPDLLSAWRSRPIAVFLCVAGLIAAVRIAGLAFADADLGADEAQYWSWSKALAFGYYSKPPLIAWTIAATTTVFGDSEWAVRLAAPLYQFGAATLLFALGRRLYDDAIGFWSGLGWLTLPGVTLSSTLMTTDAPLLFFWAAALFLFFRIIVVRESGRPTLLLSVLLGTAVGLGLLAKYAMIYFPVGAALAFVVSSRIRRGVRWSDAAVAIIVSLAVAFPNIIWNARHDFQTLSHVAANASWSRSLFHVEGLVEFLTAQFGVFGPFPLILLAMGVILLTLPRRSAHDRETPQPFFSAFRARDDVARRDFDVALLAFTLPPILAVAAQAFISRAHANWAAVAYPSAIILVTVWAFRARIAIAAKASVVLHAAAALGFIIAFSNFAIVDALGLSGAVKRVRGWEEQGAYVRNAARRFDAVLIDDRELMASMLYYARGGPPMFARDSNHRVETHFEAFMPYDPARTPRALFIDLVPDAPAVAQSFAHVEPQGSVSADLKRGRTRTLYLFEVEGFNEPRGRSIDE